MGTADEIANSLMQQFRRTEPRLSGEAERQIVRKLAAWRRLKPSMAELEASGISPMHPEFGQKIKELAAEFRLWLESQRES
jgi:hypothetical protein